MAGIPTIDLEFTIISIYGEYFISLGSLRRHPLTAALAVDFGALRPEIDAARDEELNLIAARHEASAGALFLDEELNAIVDGVSNTLLIDFDRTSHEYAEFFHGQRPSDLKRPILGAQLTALTKWPALIQQYSNEALLKYATRLAAVLPLAHDAAKELEAAEKALTHFRTLGTRAKLIQKFNALRKATYGKLGEIQHQQKLESGWAESFFRQSSSNERMTLNVFDRRIAAAEATLAALTKQRNALADREEQAAQAKIDAERAAKKARLEGILKAKADLEAEAAALAAEIGEGP